MTVYCVLPEPATADTVPSVPTAAVGAAPGVVTRMSLASKPVMEGKGVLFKKFAGIDVFDLEIDEFMGKLELFGLKRSTQERCHV